MDDEHLARPNAVPQSNQINRPLSPFEIVFWRLAQSGSLNVTTVATIEGPLSDDALKSGLTLLKQRHPLLQVRISATQGPAAFVSADVPDVPLRTFDAAVGEVEALIEAEINDPIDTERGPLVRCAWMRHHASAHHLMLTFHHVIGDGMSGVYLMRDLVRAAADRLSEPKPSIQDTKAQLLPTLHDSQPMDLRLPCSVRGPRGVWKQIRFVARVAYDDFRLRPPQRPPADQECPLAQRKTRLICRTLEAQTVDRLSREARNHATTVHGALSAAICLAAAHDHSNATAISVKHRSPVNMRQLLDPPVSDDVGMFASMAFYRGRVSADDDFWDLARDIRTSIKAQIDGGIPVVLIGMLPRLYRMIGGDRLTADKLGARWQQRTPSTTGLTNLGRVELNDDFGPLELRGLHFAVSPGGLGDCACTATTFRDQLQWNFLYADPLFGDDRALGITNDAMARLTRAIGD